MTTAIEVQQPQALTPMDPMQMIQAAFQSAIENKQGLEVVDRILEQQKWMIKHQEEQAFNAALRRIQDAWDHIDPEWRKEAVAYLEAVDGAR